MKLSFKIALGFIVILVLSGVIVVIAVATRNTRFIVQLNKLVTWKDDLLAVSSGRKPSGGARMQTAQHAQVPPLKPRTAMQGNNRIVAAKKPKNQVPTKVINPEQILPLETIQKTFKITSLRKI